MSAKILSGKDLSVRIRKELKANVDSLKQKGVYPGIAVVIAGNDPASRIYVNNKKKACAEVGINSFEYALDEKVSENELVELVRRLNADNRVNGILVQLPLPGHIDEDKIINIIDPIKDVDCFHPFNTGRLMIGKPDFLPCTPAGVMELIKESGVDVSGKECVVVGRSNIVGKPQALMLLSWNGTVTVCHSKTRNLEEVCKRADILVVAIGKPEFIKQEAVKQGAVVIDVGMNRIGEKKVVGDVEFSSVSEIAGAITPVPGGVGPMTITMLLKNTVKATELQTGIDS